MVVVAHPDDEILGLGATMNKLINEFSVDTRVVILGEGITSRSEIRDLPKWEKHLNKHKENIFNAQKEIGYHSVGVYDLPDNRFDSISLLDIVKIIENEKNNFIPEVIFTHHGGDLNIDHQLTFEAVITACRPLEGNSVKSIFTFETPSGTEWRASTDPRHFIPNIYITVEEKNMNAKINAMESYEFEKREYPHPRSPKSLFIQAQRWGIVVGQEFVEPFCLVRHY